MRCCVVFMAVLLAVALAQKADPKNVTQKGPGPKGGKAMKEIAKMAKEGRPEPKEPKGTPQNPGNSADEQVAQGWDACQVAYPNVFPEGENWLIKRISADRSGFVPAGPDAFANFSGTQLHLHAKLNYANSICQIGYQLKAQQPAGKCSDLCVLTNTDVVTPVSAASFTWSATFFYTNGFFSKSTNSQPVWLPLTVTAAMDSIRTLALGYRALYTDVSLDIDDPSLTGSCVVGCLLRQQAKAKPAAGKQADAKQVGLGVGVGVAGAALVGGVAMVVSRRLSKKQTTRKSTPSSETTIAL